MSEPAGVGLIGCGHVAEQRHLPALSRLDCARVVTLADLDPDRVQLLGERFGVARRYGEPHELLADPAVEVVGVLVPATDHAEVTIAALTSGKHVLVEKPLATSLADGERMIAAAAETAARACVGFNLRAHPLVARARELLASGVVGRSRRSMGCSAAAAIRGALRNGGAGRPIDGAAAARCSRRRRTTTTFGAFSAATRSRK